MLPSIDLAAQQARIKPKLDAAIARVLAHGQYIMGPEVAELEKRLCAFTGAPYCITCANGTDALALALMALEVRPGDAVLVPSFAFAATGSSAVPSGTLVSSIWPSTTSSTGREKCARQGRTAFSPSVSTAPC